MSVHVLLLLSVILLIVSENCSGSSHTVSNGRSTFHGQTVCPEWGRGGGRCVWPVRACGCWVRGGLRNCYWQDRRTDCTTTTTTAATAITTGNINTHVENIKHFQYCEVNERTVRMPYSGWIKASRQTPRGFAHAHLPHSSQTTKLFFF